MSQINIRQDMPFQDRTYTLYNLSLLEGSAFSRNSVLALFSPGDY